MAAAIDPGNPLYEVALTLDMSKVPEKLHCALCNQFLLNAFKTACCEGAICGKCNDAINEDCPLCHHQPFISNSSKAIRNTARMFLKKAPIDSESAKTPGTPVTPVVASAPVEADNGPQLNQSNESKLHTGKNDKPQDPSSLENGKDESSAVDISNEALPSIEETQTISRRNTLESASGNEHDDDIEIHVGPVDEPPDLERVRQYREDDEVNTFQIPSTDASQPNVRDERLEMMQSMNENGFPNMQGMGMNDMGFMNPQQMLQQMQQMQMMMSGNFNPAMGGGFPMGFGQNFQEFQNMMGAFGNNMQNMQMFMNQGNTPNFGMWNTGSSSNNIGQSYSQYNSGEYNQWQNHGGRGRGRGRNKFSRRGGHANQVHGYNDFNDPFWNNGPPNPQFQAGSFPGEMNGEQSHTNQPEPVPQHEQAPDEDDFAPGGQDEVQEALGEHYQQSKPDDPDVNAPEQHNEEAKAVSTNADPTPITTPIQIQESPKPQTPPQESDDNIPEAYKEDLEMSMAPPTAPLGPSSKDYVFRSRGHGRYASRGAWGSFHGPSGHQTASPVRTSSQSHMQSPTAKPVGTGVVGAPTGPKAMREREISVSKASVQTNGDVGLKIVGRASMQAKESPYEDSRPRSVTPRSAYDEYEERDRDSSRKYSKYDDRRGNQRHEDSEDDREHDRDRERDRDRDRRRRKSKREDSYDYNTKEKEVSHSRSDSSERRASHKRSRRDRDRDREKDRDRDRERDRDRDREREGQRDRDRVENTTSRYKTSSSKKHEVEEDDHEMDGYGDPVSSRGHRSSKKSSSKYDDRERNYDRDERRGSRKRSRNDRDRDDEYEDVDEEESRHRSRKHKKEHQSSRKEKDRNYEDTDLGMRISGRSTSHQNPDSLSTAVPKANTEQEKDPHTLEREKRNKERLAKEQQRRAAAQQGTLSGGRKVSYKYEDEIDRGMSKPSRRR